MKNNIRIGVVGCGGMAEYYHGPALLEYVKNHDRVILSACCDLDRNKAEKFRDAFRFKKAYTDYHVMLRETKIDGVLLYVPVDVTSVIAVELLQMGIPIITEKPPGMTTDEHQAMVLAAEKGKTFALTAFNRRFTPPIIYLKDRLEEFEKLPIEFIRYDFHRVGRTEPDFSTTAIHAIDTTKYLADSNYSKLCVDYQTKTFKNNKSYTNIFLNGNFISGTQFHINICPMAGINIEQITLVSNNHTFIINIPLYSHFSHQVAYQHFVSGALSENKSSFEIANSEEDYVLGGFFNETQAFLDCLTRYEKSIITTHHISTGSQSVAIMQALREQKRFIVFS